MLKLDYKFCSIQRKMDETPGWADKIKRWSQLDEASYVLAQATFENLDYLKDNFDQLIITSTQGSSKTDHQFVSAEKVSPTHFVHTLPNVRSIVFSLLTAWEGEMFCFTKGKTSLVNFLSRAAVTDGSQSTLVININKVQDDYQCDFYKLSPILLNPSHEFVFTDNKKTQYDDFCFREMLLNQSEIALSENVSLRKII